MRANLSLVLDKDGYVRLDLKKDIELSEIDKYTSLYDSSKEIREDYSDEISSFLKKQEDFTKTFKRDQDKIGRVVITYFDQKHKLHRLRVLYKDMKEKLDVIKMVENIKRTLENSESFTKTLDVINHFSGFIFGSEFDRKEIKRLEKRLTSGNVSEKLCNKNLVKNIVYNHLVLTSSRNIEKAYFHVRLIDSYMEKQGMLTTETKKVKNLKVGDIPSNTKSVKRGMTDCRVKDGNFFRESDGQLNLFATDIVDNSSVKKAISYEDYLEKEEERRLGK